MPVLFLFYNRAGGGAAVLRGGKCREGEPECPEFEVRESRMRGEAPFWSIEKARGSFAEVPSSGRSSRKENG